MNCLFVFHFGQENMIIKSRIESLVKVVFTQHSMLLEKVMGKRKMASATTRASHSKPRLERIHQKFKANVENGKFYEASHMIKTLFHRFVFYQLILVLKILTFIHINIT